MPCSAKFRNQNFQISSNLSFTIIWLCPPLYTYSPFILGKLTWPQKILEVSSNSPLPPMMPWLHGFTWYAWPYNDIFHIPHFFWETPNIRKSSARTESEPDWWVSQHPLRTPKLYSTTKKDSIWDLGEWKKGNLASSMSHVPKFVECLPWERWAVNSLIIMINYCI